MLNFKRLSGEYFKLIISSKADDSTNLSSFYVHVYFPSPLRFLTTISHPHLLRYMYNSKMKLRHNSRVFKLKPEVIHHSIFVISYDFEGKFKQKSENYFSSLLKGNVMSQKFKEKKSFHAITT